MIHADASGNARLTYTYGDSLLACFSVDRSLYWWLYPIVSVDVFTHTVNPPPPPPRELGEHWFRYWLGAQQAKNNCLNQYWLILNYASPVYGVATIFHQVRWLRWGHPSLFHIATSLLIWYKMFCVRDISYRLIWMEPIHLFSVYAQSGTHSRFNW